MYTIQDLAEGRCAVINDGTLEELNKILKEAFPKDFASEGRHKYYFKSADGEWNYAESTCLPTQSVKDFLFNPKRGDRVLVSDNGFTWYERIYLCTIEGSIKPIICVHQSFEKFFLPGGNFDVIQCKMMKPLPKAEPTTELTLEQIAEKFNVKVENLKIVK